MKKMLLASLGALAAVILCVSSYQTMYAGPLRPVLGDQLTIAMLGEVLLVFLWNIFWLTRNSGKTAAAGVGAGIALFSWCHQIFLPLVVTGLYTSVLIWTGREILRRLLRGIRLPAVEEGAMGLVLGSSFWILLVCLISLAGHGGLGLWRGLAALMGLAAAGTELRRHLRVLQEKGNCQTGTGKVPDRRNRGKEWKPETVLQAYLLAFIITMVLIQAGRMNIELDYDSLHYGLRSAFVLDNGNGIYENLGMINLVYTYSKGLEVLALPLSGTPTYGFILSFSLWMTIGILILAARIAGRLAGRGSGLWAAALTAAVPGIMNMAATAKSDNITLLYQLIIYDFLLYTLSGKKGEKPSSDVPWLLMAVSTYLLTLVYKPTALVFSTALGGIGLICMVLSRKFTLGNRRGCLLLLLPAAGTAGVWFRTWLMTGVPVTSIFAGFFEKMGCTVKYPFSFTHVIGDPSALTQGEKFTRLVSRLYGILLAPVSEDMAHVLIAWGTGLVTILIVIWAVLVISLPKEKRFRPVEMFDSFLIPVIALGCIASIFTLSQVDGNYFILFYALICISVPRMMVEREKRPWFRRGIILFIVPFLVCNVAVTCATGWAGNPGFTPLGICHKGYYDHREEIKRRRILEGNVELSSMFTPGSRVLAFGEHPQVLDLPCVVQSYYDVTGNGGNVYLVKKLAYFEQFLEYAGTEYFFVEAGYLADQPRALQIIEDMIAEGSLSDIRYEWGNMAARVTLKSEAPVNPEGAVALFHQNYSMTKND